jgi:hypothetical protein
LGGAANALTITSLSSGLNTVNRLPFLNWATDARGLSCVTFSGVIGMKVEAGVADVAPDVFRLSAMTRRAILVSAKIMLFVRSIGVPFEIIRGEMVDGVDAFR